MFDLKTLEKIVKAYGNKIASPDRTLRAKMPLLYDEAKFKALFQKTIRDLKEIDDPQRLRKTMDLFFYNSCHLFYYADSVNDETHTRLNTHDVPPVAVRRWVLKWIIDILDADRLHRYLATLAASERTHSSLTVEDYEKHKSANRIALKHIRKTARGIDLGLAVDGFCRDFVDALVKSVNKFARERQNAILLNAKNKGYDVSDKESDIDLLEEAADMTLTVYELEIWNNIKKAMSVYETKVTPFGLSISVGELATTPLKTQEAQDLFESCKIDLMLSGPSGDNSLGKFKHKTNAIHIYLHNIRILLTDAIVGVILDGEYTWAKDAIYRKVLSVVKHELLHAADWAYNKANMAEGPIPLKTLKKESPEWYKAYHNRLTEVKSWASDSALEIWNRTMSESVEDALSGAPGSLSKAELTKQLSQYPRNIPGGSAGLMRLIKLYAHPWKYLTDENKKIFLQLVFAELTRLAQKSIEQSVSA